jgi:hypothetical protein
MFASFRFSLCLLLVCFVLSSRAALVWDGPSITYTQPGIDTTQPANQDRLTPKVWLTRTNSGGLFNAFSETFPGGLSPADTEWAFGTADQYSSLTFTNWLGWLNGQSPTNLVGKQVVAHLISENIYVSMKFTFWASKGAGGFAYVRSTPPALPKIWNYSAGDGVVRFNYSTFTGTDYVVDASSDLVNWNPMVTNVSFGTVGLFEETNSGAMRFYRVRESSP